MRPDLRTRHAKAAQSYVRHKGYTTVVPTEVIEIEGDLCWYYYYDLPDGRLELEVAWEQGEWKYAVTSFRETGDATPVLAGR